MYQSMEGNSTESAAGKGTGTGFGDGKAQKQNPGSPIPSNPKSCKGCLFYSVLRHSKSKDPACFGINGTYDKLPPHILRVADMNASNRGARNKDFIYSCLGHSIYFDDKTSSTNSQNKTPKVPFCLGLEIIGYKYNTATTTESKAAGLAFSGHERSAPQPQGHERAAPQPPGNSKPAHVPGEEFLNRFRRNMGIVALGVARNLKRVGNSVKKTLVDIIDSNSRDPK